MPYINLLCGPGDRTRLSEFAASFLGHVGAAPPQERESSNYVNGHYFVSTLQDMAIEISASDDDSHDDRPFWIQVSSRALDESQLLARVDALIRGYPGRRSTGFQGCCGLAGAMSSVWTTD